MGCFQRGKTVDGVFSSSQRTLPRLESTIWRFRSSKCAPSWFLEDREIPIWEWPGNSPYLNPIENAWNLIKEQCTRESANSTTDLNEMLTDLWVHMNLDYFIKLAESMLNRLQNVIKAKSHMNIYLLYI